MQQKIILLVFLLFAKIIFAQTNSQSQPSNPILFSYTGILDSLKLYDVVDKLSADFQRDIQVIAKNINQDIEIISAPKTKNLIFPGIVAYWKKDNSLSLMFLEQTPEPIKDYLSKFTGSEQKVKELYGLQFFGYCLAHELGHWLDVQFGGIRNDYDGEYFANQIAVLWWRKQGREKELEQLVQMMKRGLKNVPLSLPEGTDLKKYMKENYRTMNPVDYNAIQCMQVIEIYEDKTLPDFDTYIKKYFANK